MNSLVSTETVTRAERFDQWAHAVSTVFGGIDSRPVARDVFRGTAVSGAVGRLRVVSIDAGPLTVRRVGRRTARNEDDLYKVALQVSGTCMVEQDGNEAALAPDDIAICDTSRPYSFTYESEFSTVLMMLPRTMLPVRPDAMRSITARRLSTDGGVGAMVGPFLRSLGVQRSLCSEAAAPGLVDGTVSLVTALVRDNLTDVLPDPQEAMKVRIRTYIETHLSDPDLTPDSIARAHGISRRYLFKLFASEDLTVAVRIRTRRLERCARDLSSPASEGQSISVIAARWGLFDSRHFSRAFKNVYGRTPRDFRNRALAMSGPVR
ncbi:helix-turn-helix domain-containing protein [Streptomyces scopuliridis]|uniref:AraC-like ligand-binding domain-containing protein n=1 Tax=Streptomyces scopuliridis TaxID=452529 RepID=UPI00367C679F